MDAVSLPPWKLVSEAAEELGETLPGRRTIDARSTRPQDARSAGCPQPADRGTSAHVDRRRMRATTGEHWIALDHLRGLAALLVFVWHFLHFSTGYPVPFEGAPIVFPLALFDEGHFGVSLFMTLSGYLFAKLLAGRRIRWLPFFWNRFLRLAPLMIVVMIVAGILYVRGGFYVPQALRPVDYARLLLKGFVMPTWPNNGWSVTVELHFYLLLPALLLAARRNPLALPAVIVAAVALRLIIWWTLGRVMPFAYLTIVGRVDQFVFGILAFGLRDRIRGRHGIAASVFLAFNAVYWLFDRAGGLYGFGALTSPSPIWIVLPTLEGAALATLIAYYDASFRPPTTGFSRFVGLAGTYSYSIYLLHAFIVFRAAAFIQERVMDISNFYVALAWGIAGFAAMMPIGYLSYRFIEAPFLRLRRPYAIAEAREGAAEG